MRNLLQHERPIVEYLFELAGAPLDLDAFIVRTMSDGGMGSLAIAPFDNSRKFGSSSAECHFYDLDGIPVSVQLNLDQDGRPFEFDVWRVDFESTVGWPLRAELLAGPPNNSFKHLAANPHGSSDEARSRRTISMRSRNRSAYEDPPSDEWGAKRLHHSEARKSDRRIAGGRFPRSGRVATDG